MATALDLPTVCFFITRLVAHSPGVSHAIHSSRTHNNPNSLGLSLPGISLALRCSNKTIHYYLQAV
jgi:hypothetical protein